MIFRLQARGYSILRLNRNITLYFFLRSAYSPQRLAVPTFITSFCAVQLERYLHVCKGSQHGATLKGNISAATLNRFRPLFSLHLDSCANLLMRYCPLQYRHAYPCRMCFLFIIQVLSDELTRHALVTVRTLAECLMTYTYTTQADLWRV